MSRTKPWSALQALALRNGWDARVTHAHDEDWCSVALRARYSNGRRVIGLWRGRSLDRMAFTSACTWVERDAVIYGPFAVLSARELREVLREY